MATSPNPFDQFDAPAAPQAGGNPFDQFDAGAGTLAPQIANSAFTQAPQKSPHALGEFASGIVRPIVSGVASLPMMALEGGMEMGHLAHNIYQGKYPTLADFNPWATSGGSEQPTYERPIQKFQKTLNYYTSPPTSFMGKLAEFVNSNIVGSAMPTGSLIANPAPEGFVSNSQQALRDASLKAAQDKGYVVPPSANNPSFVNSVLEGFAGKARVKQQAQAINEQVTQRLGAQSIGQNPDAPIIPESLPVIRAQAAAEGYEPLRQLGTIKANPNYSAAIDAVTNTATSAEKSFPGIAPQSSELKNIADALKQPQFDANSAVDAISLLRDKATTAYGAGNKPLGASYRQLSQALENQIEQHLATKSQVPPNAPPDVQAAAAQAAGMLGRYRDARTLMAKTYTLGTALTDESGGVNAMAFGRALGAGKPLTGDQRTIGDFARNFKDFARMPPGSQPAGSPLDWYGSTGLAAFLHNPLPLAIPFLRNQAKNALLSPWGQASAIAPTPVGAPYVGLPGMLPPTGYYLGNFNSSSTGP